jgi:hypothetical protein
VGPAPGAPGPRHLGADHLVAAAGELGVPIAEQQPPPPAVVPSTPSRFRAGWGTPPPSGLAVTPARWTRRLSSSMKHRTSSRPSPTVATGNQVAGEDPSGLVAQQRPPGAGGSLGCRGAPMAAKRGTDRGRRDPNPEVRPFALAGQVAPGGVLAGQPDDQLLEVLVQRWPAGLAVRGGPGAGEPCAGASPAASPASQQARPARARQHPADRVEQGPVGGLQPASWELAAPDGALVAQHQELKVRGAITAGHQPEQLDGAAQRQGGKVRYHPGRPPKDRQRPQPTELSSHTNQQVTGRIRVSVPFTVMLQSTCDQRNQTTRTRRR